MKITLNWLKEYVEFDWSPDELAERLTMLGLEVERVQKQGGEFEKVDSPFIGILAGTLDDPSWFQPQMDIFVSDAQPWDQMDPKIPKFEQYPPIPTKE